MAATKNVVVSPNSNAIIPKITPDRISPRAPTPEFKENRVFL